MSSREFDQYWNGFAWLPSGLNRIDDDLDEVERLEVLQQHEQVIWEYRLEMLTKKVDSRSKYDTLNDQIELASIEVSQHSDPNTHSYHDHADQSLDFDFDTDDWRFEHFDPEDDEYVMFDLAPDDYIDTELDPIDSASAIFMRYQIHGNFPGPRDHPEEDEWYEHPGLSLAVDMDDLIDEAATRYADSQSFLKDHDP